MRSPIRWVETDHPKADGSERIGSRISGGISITRLISSRVSRVGIGLSLLGGLSEGRTEIERRFVQAIEAKDEESTKSAPHGRFVEQSGAAQAADPVSAKL